MNRSRTLSLKKETLAELSAAELGAVAGGAESLGPSCLIGFTCLTCDICPVFDIPATDLCVPPTLYRVC